MADILTKAGHRSGVDAANKIMALEKDVAAKHLSCVASPDAEKNYNKQSAIQVMGLLGSFDWQTYADQILDKVSIPSVCISKSLLSQGYILNDVHFQTFLFTVGYCRKNAEQTKKIQISQLTL